MIEGVIFDLDGVLVDTARYHFTAWQRLAKHFGISFGEEENEALKGVSRVGSLDLILQWGGVELEASEKERWLKEKNEWYLDLVGNMSPSEIFPGVLAFMDELAANNIRIALGSSSKNARMVLDKLGIRDRFEVIVDGHSVSRSKPDPEVFELGAAGMKTAAANTVVFEDAVAGVQAALAANMHTVGVGNPEALSEAHHVIPNFEGFTLAHLNTLLAGRSVPQG